LEHPAWRSLHLARKRANANANDARHVTLANSTAATTTDAIAL